MVRTHHPHSTKALALAAQLRDAGGWDVFVAADETRTTVDAGDFPKLAHSLEHLASLGLRVGGPNVRTLWLRGDYALYASFLAAPDYDFFLMLDYDIGLRDPASGHLARLAEALVEPVGRWPDLVGVHLGPYRVGPVQHSFAEPWKAFFPLVGLSRRAILYLFAQRLLEAPKSVSGHGPVMCEVFTPSVLKAASGFHCIDVNTLLPGTLHRSGFNASTIRPVGHEDLIPGEGHLLHRVVELPEYLTKGPHLAAENGRIPLFLDELTELERRGLGTPAIDAARAEVTARIGQPARSTLRRQQAGGALKETAG